MTTEKNILIFKCLNPECGKQVKLKRPAKSGVYAVSCPHCGKTKQLKLKGLDAFDSTPLKPTAASKSAHSVTGNTPNPEIDNSSKEVAEMPETFKISEPYKIVCPHCRKQEIKFKSEKPGHRIFPCPRCKGKIGIGVSLPTEQVVISEKLQLLRGKLVLLRRGWLNKDYLLKEGKNVVGRYDDSTLCDIAIKNDSNMSRRSVEIDVVKTSKGYIFKMTVLKATNPVLHNGAQLMPGDSVLLNFGDSILLGKTKFRFDKQS